MELRKTADRVILTLKKYKHAVLIVLIGLVLMMIPNHQSNKSTTTNDTAKIEEVIESDEQRLQKILAQISGVGEVQVMLTIQQGEEILYQSNEEISSDEDSKNTDRTTVTITDGNRNETGLVRQRIPPKYKGAIVVCRGADDTRIQFAIVDAVSKVTGLGANQISVLKMK